MKNKKAIKKSHKLNKLFKSKHKSIKTMMKIQLKKSENSNKIKKLEMFGFLLSFYSHLF
jgi:hypothetical protein